MTRKAIVWFKTDLRLHDNETLLRAVAENDEIIPVYCFDEAHYRRTEFGFQKTGSFKASFILEALWDLDLQLREKKSGLIILHGNPASELYKLAKEWGVQKVYAKKEVGFEEKETEEAVEKELWKAHCTFEKYSTSTLYHAQDLPFSIKDIPDIFTVFRNKTEKESSIRSAVPAPELIPSVSIPSLKLPALSQLGLPLVTADTRRVIKSQGGETSGYLRLQHYFYESKAIATYKKTRNGLLGEDYSTKFSPWLALGCLSPRYIYEELKKYETNHGANDSTYWLVFELLWRDYFRFMMKKYGHKFFLQNGIKNNKPNLQTHNQEALYKWVNGQTGNDFIDANMIELKLTGFMSNRGRQNVASYLCNDLKLDWRYGAAYFEQQLIDYDPSSNWGNWAYLAGVGNDPRSDRYFNTEKQAANYDPKKTYQNLWLQKN
ncbi:MAG: DASH family cryptochrome [Cytophagaceae bacterium]|nr:DASH family cryptochrome [Cytophagaceae bacterium]